MRWTRTPRSSFRRDGAICNRTRSRRFAFGTPLAMPEAVTANERRILVVDDDVDAAEALGELLRDYGHDVATAHDGPQALDHARLHRPDIVLLDISMPDINGYEVAKRMRCELGLGEALIVALSGHGEDRHRHLAREAGFDHHVTKPVDISTLEELLKLRRN